MTTNPSPKHIAASLSNIDGYTPVSADTWPATQTGLLNELGSTAESFWAEINDFMALSKAGYTDDAAHALDGILVSLNNINAYIDRLIAI